MAYAKKVGIPCVCFFRTNFLDYLSDYFPLPKPIFTPVKSLLKKFIVWVYNTYDLTLVSSKITHTKIIELGIKNTCYNNLISFDAASYQNSLRQTDFFQSQYGLSSIDSLVQIVFLGRLYPDKGWDFTLDAFESISQQLDLTKVAIIIAGDSPMRSQIAAKLNTLAPHVYLLGRVLPREMFPRY